MRDTFQIDFDNYTFIRDGQNIELTATEWNLLRVLAEGENRTVHASRIVDRVWGHGKKSLVHCCINRLRTKIEPDPQQPQYIYTVPGIGYRLSWPSSSRS